MLHKTQRLFLCRSQFLSAPLRYLAAQPRSRYTLGVSAARPSSTMASETISQWTKAYDNRAHSASSDFRSDTITLPSGAMLSSILSNAPSFGDDVFSEDEPTNSLESYIGQLTGMGHAVFVLTGTMGNQIALRCLLQQPPYSVICDRRSHIFEYECGMASIFSQAQLIPVLPNVEKQAYMTLEDIIPNIVPDDGDTHGAPTKVIAIENTFWGKVTPVAEVRRIADFAKANGIKVHLDGARLWNACYSNSSAESSPAEAAATATALLREYCALVDSVSLCFSKTLGAPSGSILVAKTPEFIAKARHFRKALGGGMRQIGVLTTAARVAVDDIFLSGVHMPRVNALAKDLEDSWLALGGEVQPGLSQETNMVWLDLKRARVKDEEFVNLAKEEGVKVFDGRIVTHHQISPDAINALKRAFKRTLDLGKNREKDPFSEHKIASRAYGSGQVPGE